MSEPARVLQVYDQERPLRCDFWQENLPLWSDQKLIWTEQGEASFLEEGSAKQWLKELKKLKDVAGIFVENDSAQALIQAMEVFPQKIRELRTFDCLLPDTAGQWWPHCYLKLALSERISLKAPHLDCTQIAYITGDGNNMKVAASIAVQFGFPIIFLVIDESQSVEDTLAHLRRQYFGINFQTITSGDLTLQKNNGSLLINTARFDKSEEFIEDLSYLNFLLAGALVVDTNVLPLTNNLLSEALHVGLTTLGGAEVLGLADYLLLRDILDSVKVSRVLSSEQYLEQWSQFLSRRAEVPSEP